MSNELSTVVPEGSLSKSKYGDDEAFGKLATSSAFLPRVQLYQATSKECKRGLVPIGHYGFIKGSGQQAQLTPITNEFNCIVLGWRPKAMKIEGGKVQVWYNPKSKDFQSSVARAGIKGQQGDMYGPEYLIYLPDMKEFATFLCGNATARRESPNIKSLIGRAATFKVQFIEQDPWSWHGPVVTICSVPLPLPPSGTPERAAFDTECKEQIERFNNPPETGVEEAPEEAATDRVQ